MARFLTWALILAGALLAAQAMLFLHMVSDVCAGGGRVLRCSPTWQLFLFWLPVIGLAAGVLVAMFGGQAAARRDRSPLLWVGGGWTVFLLVLVASYLLAIP